MNLVTRFAALAALTIAATATAEESGANNDRLLLARADVVGAHIALDSIALDDYVGRYVSDGGIELFVVREDGALTIEWPETSSIAQLRLVAQDAGDFVAADAAVRVSFETGADGRVAGLVAYPRGETPIAAVKMPLPRGIVTIEDVSANRP